MGPLRNEARDLGAAAGTIRAAKTKEDLRLIKKLKDREALRGSEADPRLPPTPFLNESRKLVILSNRWSSWTSRNQEKVHRLKQDFESSFKQGEAFSGLKNAEFVDCSHTAKLPLHPGLLGTSLRFNQRSNQQIDIPNIKELVEDQKIKQIIWVLIGLEGMPVDYDSFREHITFFEDIDIILQIGEEKL